MSTVPAVIVRKGGFLSALFHGLFGFLAVLVVCSSAVGVYGLHVVDGKVSRFLDIGENVVAGLPQWKEVLPPLLADALDDHRAPDYRAQLDVTVRTAASPDDRDRELTVVEVRNRGSETVSLLALNITLENEDGVPIGEDRAYAATPILCDEAEWRGPLLPDATRRFTLRCWRHDRGLQPKVEIAELRVWNGSKAGGSHAPASADADLSADAETGVSGHAVVEAGG